MSQPAERLCLDLSYALAGHAHLSADLFKRVSLSVKKSIAQLKNSNLAWW
jgi:hypothetical protein